jgi:hypothetical protein
MTIVKYVERCCLEQQHPNSLCPFMRTTIKTEDDAGLLSMNAGAIMSLRKAFRFFLAFALFLTVLAVFVPLNPVMPADGLEPSWMFAMNQGVAQGLVFGRDIVFTFGPYASIYTELYHPATDRLMICGSLFLGLSYALLLALLGKGEKINGLLLYGIFLACLVDSRDALFFSYPLLLALVVYRMALPPENALHLRLAKPIEYFVSLLFAPLGLLPLVKVSFLPICGIIAVFCFAIFWHRGSKSLACMAMGIPAVSSVMFWRFSGQPISAMPGFFWSVRQFVSGFTEAMSYSGNIWESVLYVLASALIILVVVRNAPGPKSSIWFLSLSFTLFLFMVFKAGFVRHDQWHNITAGTSILAAALLLIFVVGEKPSLLPVAVAVLVWVYIGHGTVPTTAEDISANLQSTFAGTFQGAQTRLRRNGELRKQYDVRNAAIRTAFTVPRLAGTTDVYSVNQSWLLASGNTWAPRPVTQSYSAFTPELAELNLRHLQGANAPDNILFRVEPIDSRLPSLEDGLSWPALINGYSLWRLQGQSAYLRKRTTDNNEMARGEVDLYDARHEFGEEVTLPESNDPLFARIDIQPTLLGRALSVLYKLPELHIAMQLRDGRVKHYRVISSMMKTDFLITPLVKNTKDFLLLAAGGNKYLTGNEVKNITMSSGDGSGLFWGKTYSISLRKLNLLKNSDAENSILFDEMNETAPGNLSASSTQVCEGTIEDINGTPPNSAIPPAGDLLSIQGWMTVSGKDGIVPERVFVTLTSESGKTVYIKAHSTPHDDIRWHFHLPWMPDPGYAAMADVSSLSGRFTLGLARIYKGNLGICQQIKLPIQISH